MERGDNMKNRNEITNKLNRLFEILMTEKDTEKNENICCQIDALLWVIDDRSGAPLLDER